MGMDLRSSGTADQVRGLAKRGRGAHGIKQRVQFMAPPAVLSFQAPGPTNPDSPGPSSTQLRGPRRAAQHQPHVRVSTAL